MKDGVHTGRAAATVLMLVSMAVAGSTQGPVPAPPAPTFRASVDLVSVAAVVRDRRGQVVRIIPPLVTRDDEVALSIGIIGEALAAIDA